MQSKATRRDTHHRSDHQGEKRKSLRIAEKRDATRHNAPPSVKATSGIRTLDLRFTKAPLENESDDTASTYNGANQNPSTIPSSQAQNEGADVRLQQIIDSWPLLPEAVRAGIVAMVKVVSNK